MISADMFALANLVIWTGLLAGFAIVERRGRHNYISRNGSRYRKLTTRAMLRRIGRM